MLKMHQFFYFYSIATQIRAADKSLYAQQETRWPSIVASNGILRRSSGSRGVLQAPDIRQELRLNESHDTKAHLAKKMT